MLVLYGLKAGAVSDEESGHLGAPLLLGVAGETDVVERCGTCKDVMGESCENTGVW